ncbi:hypothetical protein SAMN04488107_2051 [Geodermatophilus saharensis]|uniref:Uncharacterized protein n=1 Tax=Geodermatophilus saharensis TaxID=1137994 RepID=A0A239D9V2_9ACTN|nr:hypothetical protein [Geodermatophilus saharensis]SNS28631.1 hypothetical protein SAMN04488107_2051 [Geodermatophilus saharensis]
MANTCRDGGIDWALPDGPPDWLLGTGAVPGERRLVGTASVVATGAVLAVAAVQDVAWSWWQWVLVAALTVDVAGGVVANALGSAKRFYHSPVPPGLPLPQRVLRSPVGFAAVHVHPFVLAALLPDATLGWAAAWYVLCLAGTAAVVGVPLHLRRPLAAAIVTVAVVAAPLVAAPAGLAWFGPVLALKLVAAHAVREEPYRPLTAVQRG